MRADTLVSNAGPATYGILVTLVHVVNVSGPVICKTELVIVSSLGDGLVASTVNGGEALRTTCLARVSTQQTLALVIAKYVNKT